VTKARTYPHGVTCWVDTEQADVEAASGFYAAVFGWTLTNALPPGEPGSYLIATFNGLDVAVTRAGSRVVSPPAQWRVTFTVTDRERERGHCEGCRRNRAGHVAGPLDQESLAAGPRGAEFIVSQFTPPPALS
jgi:hypothetical protein